MKSEMMQCAMADPGDIVRSMADVTTSQSENDDHNGSEGISEGDREAGVVIVDP